MPVGHSTGLSMVTPQRGAARKVYPSCSVFWFTKNAYLSATRKCPKVKACQQGDSLAQQEAWLDQPHAALVQQFSDVVQQHP